MNQINQQIGHKIKTKRRKSGITQADLSKKLSISPSYLNLMESGKRKINLDLLLKVANELNIEVSDISKKTDTNLYQNLMDLLGDNLFENLDITNFDVKELINTKKINKTLTFTISNFEKFVDELNKEYHGIKDHFEKEMSDKKDADKKKDEVKPAKGSRVL